MAIVSLAPRKLRAHTTEQYVAITRTVATNVLAITPDQTGWPFFVAAQWFRGVPYSIPPLRLFALMEPLKKVKGQPYSIVPCAVLGLGGRNVLNVAALWSKIAASETIEAIQTAVRLRSRGLMEEFLQFG